MSGPRRAPAVTTRAVIFDVDGVLVRSMERHADAYAAAFRPLGVKVEESEVFRHEGRGSREVAAHIAKDRGLSLSEEQLDALAKEKQRVFASFGPMPKYPGVDALVDRLHGRGLKLAMVTGTTRGNLERHFPELLPKFDVIVTADDVKRTKPDPEPYETAVRKLGLDKRAMVVVENAPLGIRSAKAAGLRVIAITTTNPADALKEADAVVERISEVEGLL